VPFPLQKPSISNKIRSVFGLRGRSVFQGDETVVPTVLIQDVSRQPWSGLEEKRWQRQHAITITPAENEGFWTLTTNDTGSKALAPVQPKNKSIGIIDYLSLTVVEFPVLAVTGDQTQVFAGMATIADLIGGISPSVALVTRIPQQVDVPIRQSDSDLGYTSDLPLLSLSASRSLSPFFAVTNIASYTLRLHDGVTGIGAQADPGNRNLLQSSIVFGRNVGYFLQFNLWDADKYSVIINSAGRFFQDFDDPRGDA